MPNPLFDDEWSRALKKAYLSAATMKLHLDIEPITKAFTENIRQTMTASQMQPLQDAFSAIRDSYASALKPDYYDALVKSIRTFDATSLDPSLMDSVREVVKNITSASVRMQFRPPDYDAALSSAFEAIRSSCGYLSEDQRELVNELSPEILTPDTQEQQQQKRWTRADILALASLIFSLIVFFYSLIPDKQLEELAAQNEIQIEQRSRELELLQQLADAEQQLLDCADQIKEAVVEDDVPALEADDPVDGAADAPEAVTADDEQEQETEPQYV